MVDLLGLGLSGLRTSRNNISVTGHNISNIDTPGYSRQRAIQGTNPAFGTGNGYYGTGAHTQTVQRIVDSYTIHQVRVDTSRYKELESYLKNASELDNLLSNENSALGNALNGFFDGLQSAANDPLSKPARQLVFSQIESVSQRFKAAQARLNDQNNNLNTQLRTYSSKINELSGGIAELNKQILIYEGSRNQPPNDLFDKRDELLRQLSEIVDVNVAEQDNLTVHVSIGNGIPLITGEHVNKLEARPSDNDKGRYEVFMRDTRGTEMHITKEITGGELGGVIRYRNDTLDPALNEIGRIAIVFAGTMNNTHKGGVDLDGNQGVNLFRDINERNSQLDRIPGLQRDASAGVWIDPEKLNQLPAQEFMIKDRGNGYVVHDPVTGRDLFHNQTFPDIDALNTALHVKYGFKLSNGTYDPANPNAFPGNLNPDPTTTPPGVAGVEELMKGGGLLISPTRLGASELERNPELTDTNKIALAGIAGAENNAGSVKFAYAATGTPNNPVGGKIILFDPLDPLDLKAWDDIDVTSYDPDDPDIFNAQLDTALAAIIDGFVAATPPNATYNPKTKEITLSINAGTPAVPVSLKMSNFDFSDSDFSAKDTWTLEGSAGGQNGSLLANLQQAKLVNANPDGSGGSSLGETYAMLVEKVGIATSEAIVATDVAYSTLNQSIAMRESVSGVNMDEEAGNLIRFQQAYMASTQVIAAAQKLFDTLFASVGR